MQSHDTLKHARILYVDDHHLFLVMIKSVLVAAGAMRLQEANSLAVARSQLDRGDLDLLIMDEMVGAERGSDLVRELRQNAGNPSSEIPILMLTGAVSPQDVRRLRDADVDQLVAKPFTVRLLLERLNKALTDRRPFIRCGTYAGPDRRRDPPIDYAGLERRKRCHLPDG